MPGQMQVGVKRKLVEVEGPAMMSYPEQRQSVLNMSMLKLQSNTLRRVEPSLRRSVLIFNTLKHIEHELKAEGVMLHPKSTPSLLPAIESTDMELDRPPGTELTHLHSNPTFHSELLSHPTVETIPADAPTSISEMSTDSSQACHLYSIAQTFSVSESLTSSTPSALTPMAVSCTTSSSDGLLNNERNISSFTSLLDLDNNNTTTTLATSTGGTALPSLPNAAGSHSSVFPSFPSSSGSLRCEQDMFSDLDMSVFDFDLLSSLSPKLSPVSPDELMHSFPVSGVMGEAYSSYSSSPPCYKNELLGDDLDHIMQVLVSI